MRKPKYSNITDFKKSHKRTPSQVANYKTYIKNHRGYVKLKEKESIRVSNLFERTKEKIKGKSKKEISSIWISYQKSKDNITLLYREKELKFSSTGIVALPKSRRPEIYTSEKSFNVSSKNPDFEIGKFIDNKIIDNEKVRYLLIILVGKNETTGEKVILSEPKSFEEIIRDGKDEYYNYYSDTLEAMRLRNTKSTSEFLLKKIMIKVTYSL